MNPYLATLLTFAIAIAFLRLMDFFAQRGWIESKLSRKFIHIGTGPIFVLCWLLFPETSSARYLAALVPLLITVQFILVGTGILKDDAAVQAIRHWRFRPMIAESVTVEVVHELTVRFRLVVTR